jgi:hypothetical protein
LQVFYDIKPAAQIVQEMVAEFEEAKKSASLL